MEMSAEEIEAYIATGEPLQCAGSFTIDGYGGAFIRKVDGDPHTVVGLSISTLRAPARPGAAWASPNCGPPAGTRRTPRRVSSSGWRGVRTDRANSAALCSNPTKDGPLYARIPQVISAEPSKPR